MAESPAEQRAVDWPPLIRALLDPACYPHETGTIEVLETHISWVLLTGPFAYKIKKPVVLPFLDFGTLALRHKFCEEELRLNQRLARNLYLDVVPIGGSPETPKIGAQPAIEYAVKMRQFDKGARLDELLAHGAVDSGKVRELARAIAEFHASCAPETGLNASARLREADENVRELIEQLGPARPIPALGRVRLWLENNREAFGRHVERRIAHGAFRDCHGDLHLENVALSGGKLVAFDALEFDRDRRVIDTIHEVSFFCMDLLAHHRPDLCFAFLTEYLEQTGDYEGLAAAPYYMVHCALVRAKVAAIKGAAGHEEGSASLVRRYIATASAITSPRRPLLVITHGFSGSGKTFITEQLISAICAIRVRSDLERKRLAGLTPLESSDSPVGGGLYTERSSEATYNRLAEAAAFALRQRFNCIVDAAFLAAAERATFRKLAVSVGAEFVILDCIASVATLRQRIRARRGAGRDASEARDDVLEFQLAHGLVVDAEEAEYTLRIDTERAVDYGKLAAELVAKTKA